MLLKHDQLTLRNATAKDSEILSRWWNDGKVMAHAGFPNGTGQTPASIARSIETDSDNTRRRLIIECDNLPIGEMCYMNQGSATADIGIKICDFSKQDMGYGRILLSMLISELFSMGYEKIILDTNLKNTRAQHVYEMLGFSKVRLNIDSWKDQLGQSQSSVDFELLPHQFVNYAE